MTCSHCMLAMQINNGTEFLHLGGDINTFLPIVTEHSQTAATSDLTLDLAMSIIKEKMEATKQPKIGKEAKLCFIRFHYLLQGL